MTTMTQSAHAMPDEDVVPEFKLQHRLQLAMEVRGIGVQEMADAYGLTRNTISYWLNGHRVPDKSRLFFFATLTGVNLQWLETGQAPGDNPTPAVPLPRLDSNQQPSGYPLRLVPAGASVNPWLTPNRVIRGPWLAGLAEAS